MPPQTFNPYSDRMKNNDEPIPIVMRKLVDSKSGEPVVIYVRPSQMDEFNDAKLSGFNAAKMIKEAFGDSTTLH